MNVDGLFNRDYILIIYMMQYVYIVLCSSLYSTIPFESTFSVNAIFIYNAFYLYLHVESHVRPPKISLHERWRRCLEWRPRVFQSIPRPLGFLFVERSKGDIFNWLLGELTCCINWCVSDMGAFRRCYLCSGDFCFTGRTIRSTGD